MTTNRPFYWRKETPFRQAEPTAADVARLTARVQRMQMPVAERPKPEPTPRCGFVAPSPTYNCSECRAGNHSHAAVPVGPYWICRCLNCPNVSVDEPPAHDHFDIWDGTESCPRCAYDTLRAEG